MSTKPAVTITDWSKAHETAAKVRVGSWFVFSETDAAPGGGRLRRLLAGRPKSTGRRVRPLIAPVALEGVTISPPDRALEPFAALCADRDLYRAEEDTVHLVCAVPGRAREKLDLALFANGAHLTTRAVELDEEGLAIEPVAALLPGRYTARLSGKGGLPFGPEASFTVAEYTLAPLSARLAAHRLDRKTGQLHFELEVESYQVSLDCPVRIALVAAGREIASGSFDPAAPGRYAGSLAVGAAEDALRLRVSVADDASRLAEVAIPGSRAAERELTVVSELGREVLMSLMPEAGALPVRGAYFSEGDFLATPVVAGKIEAVEGTLTLQADVESLVLITLDLTTGELEAVERGDVQRGTQLTVTPSPACTVFVGGFVDGEPFEGYASFLRPSKLALAVEAPTAVKPREPIRLRLSVKDGRKSVPVVVAVRDRRLTVTDDPQTSLAASIKRGVSGATEGMAEAGISRLDTLMPAAPVTRGGVYFGAMPLGASPGVAGAMPERRTLSLGRASAAPASTPMSVEVDRGYYKSDEESHEDAAPQPEEPARESFPEQLFFGLVPVSGSAELEVQAGESLGTFVVEAFALSAGDWARADATVTVEQPVRADLELPPAVHDGDRVRGRLRAAAASGRAKVSLTRDGEAVAMTIGGKPAPMEIATPAMLAFDVTPGRWCATVEDAVSGERDRMEVEVGRPGRFKSLVREVALLQTGDALTLESTGALSLRVLPGLDAPFKQLVDATADYGHLCCEQTAAKILSAVVMWLTADGPAAKSKAEGVILTGIAREQRMWKRGRGFAMYPEQSDVHDHYSPLVVRHLWSLKTLQDAPGMPARLAEAVTTGLTMADDVARRFDLQPVPARIASADDAYAVARGAPARKRQVSDWIGSAIDLTGREAKARASQGAVADRALLAAGAAALLALGDIAQGVKVANPVTRALGEEGRLYSTVDCAAAIALFGELARAGIGKGGGKLRANGQAMSAEDAERLADQLESIEVTGGVVPVEVTRIVEEDWSRFKSDLPVKVGFRNAGGRKVSRPRAGDRIDLHVELPKGYRAGDLVHVALPACLSWIEGGGRVKRFTRDFEGKNELTVPLVVTGELDGKQHFAVCVRNMFEEERAASPGLLALGG